MLLLYRTGRLTQCDGVSFCQESLEPFSFVSSLHTKCWLCASQPLARGARNRAEVGEARRIASNQHRQAAKATRQELGVCVWPIDKMAIGDKGGSDGFQEILSLAGR